ncbi:MAG TPA: class I SAM-dependent methyltransferase [Synergistales bacterium]|nr:class I SAM-dependent methyltransferase [Synergistales bacterium]
MVYESELEAIRKMLPGCGKGLEIGVGTGRFAAPLGIGTGLEPSSRMAEIAREKGIFVMEGVAEDLPFSDSEFDYALMVTTICFVDDLDLSFREAFRILKEDGVLVIGLVDRQSHVGKIYEKYREKSHFYQMATFYSVEEVVESLKKAGFQTFSFNQTIFRVLGEIIELEPIRKGYGEGSFVVIRAKKKG